MAGEPHEPSRGQRLHPPCLDGSVGLGPLGSPLTLCPPERGWDRHAGRPPRCTTTQPLRGLLGTFIPDRDRPKLWANDTLPSPLVRNTLSSGSEAAGWAPSLHQGSPLEALRRPPRLKAWTCGGYHIFSRTPAPLGRRWACSRRCRTWGAWRGEERGRGR